jgi:hypothetical protein
MGVVGGGVGFPALGAEDLDRVVLWIYVLPQLMVMGGDMCGWIVCVCGCCKK